MCAILGFFNTKNATDNALKGMDIIKDRGRDNYGLATEKNILHNRSLSKLKTQTDKLSSKNCLAHCLHSIVSFTPQPLKKTGIFISNNEVYNWKFLNNCFKTKAKNDSDLIFQILEQTLIGLNNKNLNKKITGLKKTLMLFDGVYAFAYWAGDYVLIARDILGIKPVFYSNSKEYGFAFASESKVLKKQDYPDIKELNPRSVLIYNTKTNKIQFSKRSFFSLDKELTISKPKIIEQLKGLLIDSITKRIPDKKFGILMSGGVDSTFIALICKQLGLDFTCYTACLEEHNIKESEDMIYSRRFCKEHDIPLKIAKLSLDQVHEELKVVVPLIEDSNVVKVGVALTFYEACKLAKKDGVKVIFSGLGSEEIFAGYDRHTRALNINKECRHGLMMMYERDLYRDDCITMNNNIELRIPFLDKRLIGYSLKIPSKYKIGKSTKAFDTIEVKTPSRNTTNSSRGAAPSGDAESSNKTARVLKVSNVSYENKLIFRETAEALGLDKDFAYRKKVAAQYGSKFDKAIKKISHRRKFQTKSEYLDAFYKRPNVKLAALFSSGKDSSYALYTMQRQNYEISCLVSLMSKNPASYMFHTPNINLVKLQAQAMSIPLIQQQTDGKKEHELKDLETALKSAKDKYDIEGVVTGALFSTYQRDRIQKVCEKLQLKIFSPLWHINQKEELESLLKIGFKIMFSSVQAYGFNKAWLGKIITESDLQQLILLNRKYKINIAGEGGEYESLVLDAPMFKKKISIQKSKIIVEDENTAFFVVEKARLTKK